jgi:WD40 repeat protein
MAARGAVLLVSGGYDHTIRFWDITSGTIVKQIPVPSSPSPPNLAPVRLQFCRSRRASHSRPCVPRGLSFRDGMCLCCVQFPDSPINLLRISPDRRLLAVAGNPHVRMYRTDAQSPGHSLQLEGHTSAVTSLVFGPDRTSLYTGCEDKTVKIWDIRTGHCLCTLKCATPVNCVCLHPSLPLLVSGELSGSLCIWDVNAKQKLREVVTEQEDAVRACAFAPDGSSLVVATNSGRCAVWLFQQTQAAPAPAPQAAPANFPQAVPAAAAASGTTAAAAQAEAQVECSAVGI